MAAYSSHRASFVDDERPYHPSSSHTSHSLKSAQRDSQARPASHGHSHSAKDKPAAHHSPSRSASPSHSRLRALSTSASSSPARASLLPTTSSHPPSHFHSSLSSAFPPPPAASTAHALLSDAELHELRAAFGVFDRDGTGRVPSALLLATLRSLPPHPSHALLASLLPSASLSFDEFVSLVTSGVGSEAGGGAGRAEWERVFALMDEGGKGWLDEADMERVRRTVGGGKGGGGKAEVRAMLARADLNGDGVVSRDEFVALMMEDKVM